MEENEKAGLKLNIKKTKIMASSPMTSWQMEGENIEAVTYFIFLGSKKKKSLQSDCSHEIKWCLLIGRKAMTNIDSILQSRGITLPINICIVKAMYFPVVMYECESWNIKKTEQQRIGTFKLWYWRRFLRASRTTRRSNQSILKEINPEPSFEGLMLKLKLQYLATWFKEPTQWERSWCWEWLKAKGERRDRWWDG